MAYAPMEERDVIGDMPTVALVVELIQRQGLSSVFQLHRLYGNTAAGSVVEILGDFIQASTHPAPIGAARSLDRGLGPR